MSGPNETWSERFEREFEAGVALLRRRPLLAILFAGAMVFFAWHQFFKAKESLPAAPAAPKTGMPATSDRAAGTDTPSVAAPSQPFVVSAAPDTLQTPAAKTATSTTGPDAELAPTPPIIPPTMKRSLADYFDQPIAIGDSRTAISEHFPKATWGQYGQEIFSTMPATFLGRFSGTVSLLFSNDLVTQVNFLHGYSGSTMRNYRLHGTDDEWEEKTTTNGEDISYAEATAKCAPFTQLRAELIRRFGAAKSLRDIPFAPPESDSRTRLYSRPAEDRFDAWFETGAFKLHIIGFDFAFIREQTHTIMAKDKLSHRSCSIRAEFTKSME